MNAASRAPWVALVLWVAVVIAGAVEGVYARIEAPAFIALVAFSCVAVPAFAWIDREARSLLRTLDARLAWGLALAADLVLVASVGYADSSFAELALFPAALVPMLVAPMALVMHMAAVFGPSPRPSPTGEGGVVRKAPAASRRATRVAT
jgi:hypothetical protein